MNNQISFLDKPKIKLLEDWTRLHPLLTKIGVIMSGFGICDKCKRYRMVKEKIVVNGNEIRVFLLCNECQGEKDKERC